MTNIDGSNQVRLTNDPAGDTNPTWSPVSDEVAFVSNRFGNSNIFIVNTLNLQVSTMTESTEPDYAPAWSPDGQWIAYKTLESGELSQLYVINRNDLSNQIKLTQGPSDFSSPVWSPNGQQIAATAKQSGGYGVNIFNVFSDEGTIQLFSQGVEPHGIAIWSPEGARLVFQAQTGGEMELYVATVPTNEFIRLTSTVAYEGEPIWVGQ